MGGGKIRNSNLELYRIVVMLLIVAHHYVVNSGLLQLMEDNPLTGNSIFLYLFGMWGKTGMNCFVLITGYFMCRSKASVTKFLKLIIEVAFYKVIIYLSFVLTGVIDFQVSSFVKALIPVGNVATGFTTAFIVFYLFIPFLNILIHNLNKCQHERLIALCLVIYTIWDMSPYMVRFNYVSWFIILYFIASYIRTYPIYRDNDCRFWSVVTIISLLLSSVGVLVLAYTDISFPYAVVQDSNTFMALMTAICSFMLFKNLRVKQSKLINAMGASTFGVLLIHANSDAMRQWLWRDTLCNVEWYSSSLLWVHAIVSVISIFLICVVIDQLRINLIERPFFASKLYRRLEISIQGIIG